MTAAEPWPRDWRERDLVGAAEREGSAFLLLRDADSRLALRPLEPGAPPLVVGRRETSDLALSWDDQVSRQHCALERLGHEWAVTDDGLSRNGTYVNGTRVMGRRWLRDGDVLRVGRTPIVFRRPAVAPFEPTSGDPDTAGPPALSFTQRRVLLALARPLVPAGAIAPPATNGRIAAELHLSVAAVKAHLRVLFRKFGIEDLPQNEKRTRLAALALGFGLASGEDARDPPEAG